MRLEPVTLWVLLPLYYLLLPVRCFVLAAVSAGKSGFLPGTRYQYEYVSRLSLNTKKVGATDPNVGVASDCSALGAEGRGRDLRADFGALVGLTPVWVVGDEELLELQVSNFKYVLQLKSEPFNHTFRYQSCTKTRQIPSMRTFLLLEIYQKNSISI